jgi:subtilisin family serine protease
LRAGAYPPLPAAPVAAGPDCRAVAPEVLRRGTGSTRLRWLTTHTGEKMWIRRSLVAVLVIAGLGVVIPTVSASQVNPLPTKRLPAISYSDKGNKPSFDPHTVLVRFKKNAAASAMNHALSSRGLRTVESVAGFVKVHTDGDAVAAAAALRRDAVVQQAILDFRVSATAIPNDPGYVDQSGYLTRVRMPPAWDLTKGSTAQIIAVVDTGVDINHPDLLGRTVGGFNAITNSLAQTDDNGHGTMVAGIAAANTNNAVGVAGVAWVGRIMPVKVLGADGTGLDSDVAQGIQWAADHGAKIINLSLDGPDDSAVLHSAVQYATGKGALCVVAAGNSASSVPEFPAAYDEAFTVGATDSAGSLAYFSSWGTWVDLVAPGMGIISTYARSQGFDYAIGDGTSFAAPIVSGVAALVRTRFPAYTPAQLAFRLRSTARDAGPRGIDPYYGNGLLDADNAVGGAWAAELATPVLGTGEPNDTPARAIPISVPGGTGSGTGTMGAAGDTDWYQFTVDSPRTIQVTVTPAPFDVNVSGNFDPILDLYDAQLRSIGHTDSGFEGDAEQLTATVPAGTTYIATHNFNGSTDLRPYGVHITAAAAPLFGPYQTTNLLTSDAPQDVEFGDVTGDGRPDVVASTGSYDSPTDDLKIFVLAQEPDGTLAAPVKYTPLQASIGASFALADVNGDDRLDVIVPGPDGIEALHQTGQGTLATDTDVLTGTAGNTSEVVAAEMTGDALTDLVAARPGGIVLFTQQQDHTFQPTTISADGAGQISIGDVDGDGLPDVVTLSNGLLHVYRHGDSWNRTDPTPSGTAMGIDVADVNSDDLADILVTILGNQPNSKLNVFTQTAQGGLTGPAIYNVPDIPSTVGAADMNGDGRTDVIMGHGGWSEVSVLPQNAQGTLGTPLVSPDLVPNIPSPYGMSVGDISGDGRPDVAVASMFGGVSIIREIDSLTPPGDQVWVRAMYPPDFANYLSAASTVPRIDFQRPLDPSSVTAGTVRLVNGRTGAAVPVNPVYDGSTNSVTLPGAAMMDNTPYRIVVSGLHDLSANTMDVAYTSTFRTLNTAPGAVTGLIATPGVGVVNLSWTPPPITDLDQVIVRMAASITPPSSPTSGIGVYASTGTSVKVSGLLSGSPYSFAIWVHDRTGLYSTVVTKNFIGTAVSIATNTTAVTYGGNVTVTGTITRTDSHTALAGVAVHLFGRRKGTSTWTLFGTVTSSSTGTLSFVHKPAWSLDYMWQFPGNTAYMGADSVLKTVGVRVAIVMNLSTTTLTLGGTLTVSGTVAPNHAGRTVYLQRLFNGVWTTISHTTLSSTSAYTLHDKPTVRGTYGYRVYFLTDTDHLTSYAGFKTVQVV